MAGDWIKIRKCLFTHPKVIVMARQSGMCEEVIVGWLAKLWSWADDATANGHVDSVTPNDLSRVTGAPLKLLASMQHVGWLVQDSTGVCFPDYENHMGKSAKQRVLAQKRQQNRREKVSRTERDKSVTREEKRREEYKKKSKPKESREARPASIEAVRAYVEERVQAGNRRVDAQAWYDHYEANGWRVGRNAMKDWKAAVRSWERNGVGAVASELGGKIAMTPKQLRDRARYRLVKKLVADGMKKTEAIAEADRQLRKKEPEHAGKPRVDAGTLPESTRAE